MEISAQGLRFIEGWESYAAYPYQDQGGNWTWGYGHKQLPGEPIPQFISQRQATQLLDHDVAWAEAAVNHHVAVALVQAQFDALVDFTYNVGAQAFIASTLLRLLNQGEYDAVAPQLLRWDHVWTPNGWIVSQGLRRRRVSEGNLFNYGDYRGNT